MFHEIKGDGGLGVRTDGSSTPIFRSDGTAHWQQLEVATCRDFGFWPEVPGTTPAPPHRYVTESAVYVKQDASQDVRRDVSWTEWDLPRVYKERQGELEQTFTQVRRGGCNISGNAVPTTTDAETGYLLQDGYLTRVGWPLPTFRLPVYLIPASPDRLYDKFRADEGQWRLLMDTLAIFEYECRKRADELDDALVAAYDSGSGTVAALVAVDLKAGWPPEAYTSP